MRSGPLAGVRFVELAGIGPVPLAATVLADLGAEGIRVESPRLSPLGGDPQRQPSNRGRPSVVVDVKQPAGLDAVLRLAEQADVLLEGFRPGVLERMGLGPDVLAERNPRLVVGRMTGWGQDGPLAASAGHDITYLATAGPLRAFAREGQPPVPPLNLVADYGGGAMLLVAGVLAALVETSRSGRGQVVDAAMVDGAALLMTSVYGFLAQGGWSASEPGTNLLDTGAPFYDVYACSDGRYVGVGALEPQFYAALLDGLGLADAELPAQHDRSGWPVLRSAFAEVFAERTRDDWAAVFEGTDACVAPVLDMTEAPRHPHLSARATFATVDGILQPSPAPRFSRTPGALTDPPSAHGADTDTALPRWGFSTEEVAALRSTGVVR